MGWLTTLRRRVLQATVAVAVAASWAVVPPVGAAAAGTCGGQLCGATTLTGSSTGVVVATLARTVSVSFDTITMRGSGRLVGAAITADRPDRKPLFMYSQTSDSGSFGMSALKANQDGSFSLPAGRYRFYLLADGSPASVTLRLQGLTGTTSLATTAIGGYLVKTFSLSSMSTGAPATRALAINHTMVNPGLAGTILKLDSMTTPTSAVASVCRWAGTAPASANQQPGCPGTVDEPYPFAVGSAVMANVDSSPVSGAQAIGGYVTTTSGQVKAEQVAFWLELR